ncbi:pyruvate, water dikinase regulatory protein [Olsenella sp. YH-ols2217]|uniref:Putative pyruvate, phosphate dikinase regulatory protein n=1 Tax=Kribbibacterium absianum TaxID=3044210 RepID=A0ABT6ZIZ5_9ACTN|nr:MULTISPECIES: pyruvate, water dikinase regulatory protein [unclassified Olsenella]MDJ1121530.1 pyruvate, water dikinase regulatory protein [Olsenella sp. YH-ols2216]MDJ1129020.1 pyruvate, water dikinase regulatory protein [Olsenella sp. YH-ols2217]
MSHNLFDADSTVYAPDCAIVHIVSDSLGETATGVVLAAESQFEPGDVQTFRLAKLQRVEQLVRHLDKIAPECEGRPQTAFHTIVDPQLRRQVREEFERRGIPSIDLLGPAMSILSILVGKEPKMIAGINHNADERYFKRIEAMEFFVEHDDGRNPQDLAQADIVLIGVSRTSKTPLSMYLAFQGYKVANVPLALGTEPPIQLEDVDPARVFGLMSTTDTLVSIRERRLVKDGAAGFADKYADPAEVVAEQQEARALMRHLGCLVVNTAGKAVEETANEIIAHIKELELLRAQFQNQDAQ